MRAEPAELHEGLRRVLAAHLVDGVEAPPNYSVRLATEGGGPARGFHLVYRRHNIVLRTRDPRRLVAGLVAHLGSHAPAEGPGEATVDGLAVVGDAGAVVLPRWAWTWLPEIEARLRAQGWRVADRPQAVVDLAAGELVVRAPALAVDAEALDALVGDLPPASRPEAPIEPGRQPLLAWLAEGGRDGAGPGGAAVVAAAGAVVRPRDAATLAAVAELRGRAALLPLPVGDIDTLLAATRTFGKNLPAP